MAAPNGLDITLAEFTARVHNTKNRLVAIPARVQRELGLERRPNNHLVQVSIRKAGAGRWNHHYFELTGDNEFAIPSDVIGIARQDEIDVKVHAIIADERISSPPVNGRPAAGILLDFLANAPAEGWRRDGADRHDDYLNDEMLDRGFNILL